MRKKSYRHRYDLPKLHFRFLEKTLAGILHEGTTPKGGAPTKRTLRNFLNALSYLHRNGCTWRGLPGERFGPWNTVYQRHKRWEKAGVYEKLFAAMGQYANMEVVIIDGTVIRAHQHSAGIGKTGKESPENQDLGRSVAGVSSKLHAVVDKKGRPIKIYISAGNIHDVVIAPEALREFFGITILADKGYDSDALIQELEGRGCTAYIPSRSNRKEIRKIDKEIYKFRKRVEHFFAKLKQFRGVATRYDKLSSRYMSRVYFCATLTWLWVGGVFG